MFAYQSIRLAGICLLLGCEVGAALSLNDIYDEGHLYYTGAGNHRLRAETFIFLKIAF